MGPGVDGVLLAAGSSRRAGTFKMDAEIAGKPLLAWSLEAMAAVCRRVIVVAGSQAERIQRLLAGRPEAELVVNGNFASGMLTSVQAGAARVSAPRFFLLPGDMPLVRASVYRRLLSAAGGLPAASPWRAEWPPSPSGDWGTAGDIVVPACGGRRGHPVLFSSSLVPAILAEAASSSLGAFIRRHGSVTVEVNDPAVLADLDDREDFGKIDALLRAGGNDE